MTAASVQPDLRIRRARVWDGDSVHPGPADLLIRGGRIEHIGRETSAGPETRTIDAGGRVVTPGLIDAHVHLVLAGLGLAQLDLSGVASRDEFEDRIAARHAALPEGEWLIARGWSEQSWPSHEAPDKTWLRAAGDRPVVCHRMDLHAVLVNDAVLALCDLETPLTGGRIVRSGGCSGGGGGGEATGLLVEAAAWKRVNPLIPESGAEARQAALLQAQTELHRCGVTAVGSMEYARTVEEVFLPLLEKLTLRCRITLLDRDWPLDIALAGRYPAADRLRVIGFKAFVDGTLGSRSARLLRDYADDPGNRGLLVELAADGHLNDWARAVAEAGLSPSIHAIGDEAARLALDALDAIPADVRAAVRPRIEHAQQIDPADIPRFEGGRGVVTSMQPLHKADDGRYAERRLGAGRLHGTFCFRRLLEAGAMLAFGSDWPVVSCDPRLGIRAAVTGLTLDGVPFLTDQNLTPMEAVRAYTSGSAFALGLDDAGALRRGGLADLVLWADDPFSFDWADSGLPAVAATIVGGRVVYDAARDGR